MRPVPGLAGLLLLTAFLHAPGSAAAVVRQVAVLRPMPCAPRFHTPHCCQPFRRVPDRARQLAIRDRSHLIGTNIETRRW